MSTTAAAARCACRATRGFSAVRNCRPRERRPFRAEHNEDILKELCMPERQHSRHAAAKRSFEPALVANPPGSHRLNSPSPAGPGGGRRVQKSQGALGEEIHTTIPGGTSGEVLAAWP